MRLASFGFGPLQKAALFAVDAKERKMRVYSLIELFCMTRNELFALHAEIVAKMGDYAEGSAQAFAAHDLPDGRAVQHAYLGSEKGIDHVRVAFETSRLNRITEPGNFCPVAWT